MGARLVSVRTWRDAQAAYDAGLLWWLGIPHTQEAEWCDPYKYLPHFGPGKGYTDDTVGNVFGVLVED